MKVKFPKFEKTIPKILPTKPKGQSYQMTFNTAKEETDVALGTFIVYQITTKTLLDLGADDSFISLEFGRKLSLSSHRLNSLEMVKVACGRNVYVTNKLENVTINLNENEFHR